MKRGVIAAQEKIQGGILLKNLSSACLAAFDLVSAAAADPGAGGSSAPVSQIAGLEMPAIFPRVLAGHRRPIRL